MTFVDKKNQILECVRLGMDVYKSQLVVACTQQEIDQMDNDPEFLSRVELHKATKETDLLEMHDTAINTAKDRGDTRGIQWRLEKLNPKESNTLKINATGKMINENINHSEEEKNRISQELLEILKMELSKNQK